MIRKAFPNGPYGGSVADAVAVLALSKAVTYHMSKGVTPERLIEIFTEEVANQS